MKFAVLGAAGRMGKMHATNLRWLGHEVVPVDNRDPAMIWPDQIGNYLGSCDGVVICTPAERHIIDINTAVAAQLPCFVEKPVCLIHQVPAMRKLLLDANMIKLPVWVGYNLRFHPEIADLREEIASGNIDPVAGVFVMGQRPARPLAHFLEEWASHEVDLALWLMGRDWTFSREVAMPAEPATPRNLVSVVIHHKGGRVSVVTGDAVTEPRVRSATVVDRKGRVHSVDLEKHPVRDDDYRAEIEHFTRSINGPMKSHVLASGGDGLAAIDIFHKNMIHNR